jgi:iron complex transport system substrate-binding protein
MRDLDEVTGLVVDAAVKLHKRLGPGLLESVYEMILEQDLNRAGLMVERQRPISFEYEGIQFTDAFRIDLLVENSVVVELKSVEQYSPVYSKQVLTYLKLMNLPVGLLLNFGAPTMKDGTRRIVNGYEPGTKVGC